jgi:hypothetical protein
MDCEGLEGVEAKRFTYTCISNIKYNFLRIGLPQWSEPIRWYTQFCRQFEINQRERLDEWIRRIKTWLNKLIKITQTKFHSICLSQSYFFLRSNWVGTEMQLTPRSGTETLWSKGFAFIISFLLIKFFF